MKGVNIRGGSRIALVGLLCGCLAGVSAGCGASKSVAAPSATRHGTKTKGCPSGTAGVNENGAVHCFSVHSSSNFHQSHVTSYVSSPKNFQLWPAHTPVWRTVAKVTLPFAWSAWQPLLRQGRSFGIEPNSILGLGFNPTLFAAASTNLMLSTHSFDATEWVAIALPSNWSNPNTAPKLAQWSVNLIRAWETSLSSKGHPALIVRWMVTPTSFIQIGRTGTTTDEALATEFGQLEGWAITISRGSANVITESTQLLSPPANLVPSYVSQSDWVYSSSNAITWLTDTFENGNRLLSKLSSPSPSSQDTTATSSSVPSVAPSSSSFPSPSSAPPSSTTPSSSAKVPSSSTSSPSSAPNDLTVSAQDAPTGIQVSWVSSTSGDATPSQGCTVDLAPQNGSVIKAPLQNGGIVSGLTVGQTYGVQDVSCSDGAFGYGQGSIEYGMVATQLISLGISSSAINPNRDWLFVEYDKSLTNQMPSQNFADYVVTDTTTGVRLPVNSVSLSGGELRIGVTIPAGVQVQSTDTIRLTTTAPVVTTQHGAPSLTDVTSPFN